MGSQSKKFENSNTMPKAGEKKPVDKAAPKKAAPKAKVAKKSKKPQTAYFIFSGEKRAEVSKANPALRNNEVVTELAERWKGVSDSEEKKYTDKAAAEKKKFEDDKKAAAELRKNKRAEKKSA
ncbi:MAG: hypothetical protein EZS28_027043 [Streblomastix strix]|uniref:HMG box domain-containing protein n=1 Tax=Streblomastix strix TaxID=222440 RepID=A0A5J4V539_9EUKA|nr:MAG: hypothetical protein EZS28_027043 [Streblomastix strix]